MLAELAKEFKSKDFDELVKAKMFDQYEIDGIVYDLSSNNFGDKSKQEQIFLSALEECEKLGYERDSLGFIKIKFEVIKNALIGDDQEKISKAIKEWKEMINWCMNFKSKYAFFRLTLENHYAILLMYFSKENPEEFEKLALEWIEYYIKSEDQVLDLKLIDSLGGFYYRRNEINKMKDFLKDFWLKFKEKNAREGNNYYNKSKSLALDNQ